MIKRVVALIVLVGLFQGYQLADRDTVIAEYQPILIEKAANFTDEVKTAGVETTLLETQIHTTINSTLLLMNTQIATLKSTITTAKNLSADNPNALSCISVQEAAANKLSSTSINATCWAEATFQELVGARDDITVLAKIPNNTITACATLDPLPSQDELFESCVVEKILDLDEQLGIILTNFENIKAQTLSESVTCLADASASVGTQISEINYEVTLCLSLS